MGLQYTPVTPVLVAATVVSVGLLGYLLSVTEPAERDRAVWGVLLILGGAAVWSLSDAVALSLAGIEAKILLEQLEAPASLIIVLGWFVFAAEYTDRQWWLGWPLWVLVAGFVVGSLLVVTNQFHDLMWRNVRVVTDSGFAVLAYDLKPIAVAVVLLSYVGIFAGVYALLRVALTGRATYRGQALALVVSAVVPTVANVKTWLSLPPYPNVDLSAIALTITGVALAFAIVRYRLLDVTPVARRRVVEQMRDCYVVVDDDRQIVDLNPRMEALLGSDDVIGRDLTELLPADDAERLFSDGDDVTEMTFEGTDGQRVFEARTSPLEAVATGETQLVMFVEVTERKRRERELQRQNERLEQFASVVSHDLRNPLDVAALRLDLARRESDLDDVDQLDEVEQAHDRMERIIENLLTLAREGETVGETEPVALGAVAREAWETVETGNATMTVADELTVEADPDRLRQLLENVFRNSIEHGTEAPPAEADGGEDAVTVRVGACADGDGFYVADDGPGLPDEGRDQLFEFGYTTEEGGTGFGLAIVGEIAEAHGWEVRATDATWGDGTTGSRFEFTGVETSPT